MARDYVKVFVYVPQSRSVRAADGCVFDDPLAAQLAVIGRFADKGVGVVGNYDNVSFTFARGTGHYRARPGANPTKGEIGEVHAEEETVLTFVAPKAVLGELLPALKDAHPYEMPAIEMFELVRHELDGFSS
jgi:hypothetical protein